MSPHLLSLIVRTLPPEIVFKVVREVWTSFVCGGCETWNARWAFFYSVFQVSRCWNAVVQDVALRYVAIHTPRDLEIYRWLAKRRFGVDPYSKDGERVHPSAREYFQYSEVHIVLAGLESVRSVCKTDYALIPRYVSTCKQLRVIIKEFPMMDGYNTHPYRTLFAFLSQYKATPTVHLAWTHTHISRYVIPKDRMRGVTYLRISHYPRCVCHNFRLAGGRTHARDCFSFYLPTLFPDLRHLHIDTPCILKGLWTLANVTTLTLEVPPIHFTRTLGHFSSLAAWNINSALARGLFRPEETPKVIWKRARQEGKKMKMVRPWKKIVVNTGPNEPTGWSHALIACQRHGVELELRHVYDLPMTQTDTHVSTAPLQYVSSLHNP